MNNSISTINRQNICFWTYTVGLLAAVATGEVVGLAAVVMIESVEKQKNCKASSGSQSEGTGSLSLLVSISISDIDLDGQKSITITSNLRKIDRPVWSEKHHD